MKILFTSLLVIGYIGHSALFFKDGNVALSTAMICFALAMALLF